MSAHRTLDLFTEVFEKAEKEYSVLGNQSPLRFIDLFAGIGGFHVALGSLGGECVFASEKDTHARATYTENFGIAPEIFNDDIRKIAPEEIPDHDVLCAGFPCQPFSQAGNKKGFSDGENSERGNLFYCILDILEAKRPKAFILENVRHLIAHDNGKTFATIVNHLKELQYEVHYKIIKASDFNVPQNRPRVFIVGFDRRQVDVRVPFYFPMPVPLVKTMSTIFKAACEKKIGFTVRVGGKGSLIDDRRNWEFYRVNGEIRRIGVEEAREMMSFPKTFHFPVSKTQAMKQLGNSVCVEVVKAVAKTVAQYVNQHSKKELDNTVQNKGEISEAYALLKIIHQKVIQYGGAPDDAIRVVKIKHQQKTITLNDISAELISADGKPESIPVKDLITEAELKKVVSSIRNEKGTFNNERVDKAITALGITKRKGRSTQKEDISVEFEQSPGITHGISIKSFLGSRPSVVNPSAATNFIYEVKGITENDVSEINQIDTQSKIKDRLNAILSKGGSLCFEKCENEIYTNNLIRVHSKMPEILGDALLATKISSKPKGLYLEEYEPKKELVSCLGLEKIQECLKDFLKYALLGMFPKQEWNGDITATGLILVAPDGELTFYNTQREDLLKNYLYANACFDTPSRSARHRFGRLYKEGKKVYFKLNLQLRLAKVA